MICRPLVTVLAVDADGNETERRALRGPCVAPEDLEGKRALLQQVCKTLAQTVPSQSFNFEAPLVFDKIYRQTYYDSTLVARRLHRKWARKLLTETEQELYDEQRLDPEAISDRNPWKFLRDSATRMELNQINLAWAKGQQGLLQAVTGQTHLKSAYSVALYAESGERSLRPSSSKFSNSNISILERREEQWILEYCFDYLLKFGLRGRLSFTLPDDPANLLATARPKISKPALQRVFGKGRDTREMIQGFLGEPLQGNTVDVFVELVPQQADVRHGPLLDGLVSSSEQVHEDLEARDAFRAKRGRRN